MTHVWENNEEWNKFSPVLVQTPKVSADDQKIVIVSDEQNQFIFVYTRFCILSECHERSVAHISACLRNH